MIHEYSHKVTSEIWQPWTSLLFPLCHRMVVLPPKWFLRHMCQAAGKQELKNAKLCYLWLSSIEHAHCMLIDPFQSKLLYDFIFSIWCLWCKMAFLPIALIYSFFFLKYSSLPRSSWILFFHSYNTLFILLCQKLTLNFGDWFTWPVFLMGLSSSEQKCSLHVPGTSRLLYKRSSP